MTEHVTWHHGSVPYADRHRVTGGPGATVWVTGLSGSGKSTIGAALEETLIRGGRAAYRLDGDNLRHGLNADLAFSADERTENIRRVGEVARLFADAGLVAIVPVISPYRADRDRVRLIHREADLRFVEVFVDTPIEVCEQRDPKGLYAKARAGEIRGFTGIDDPYEPPLDPELRIDTSETSVEEAVAAILGYLPGV